MAIFRFFKRAAAAVLDFFFNFEILTVGSVKGFKLRQSTKFSGIDQTAGEI